jgi:hypothetical protein
MLDDPAFGIPACRTTVPTTEATLVRQSVHGFLAEGVGTGSSAQKQVVMHLRPRFPLRSPSDGTSRWIRRGDGVFRCPPAVSRIGFLLRPDVNAARGAPSHKEDTMAKYLFHAGVWRREP